MAKTNVRLTFQGNRIEIGLWKIEIGRLDILEPFQSARKPAISVLLDEITGPSINQSFHQPTPSAIDEHWSDELKLS